MRRETAFSGAFEPRMGRPAAPVAPALGTPRRVALRGYTGGNIEWWMYQQAFIPQLYFSRPRVDRATLGTVPTPPGVCCQRTKDGQVICSDGRGYPGGCPNCPEVNTSGEAEYQRQGSTLVPVPPRVNADGSCSGAAAPVDSARIPSGAASSGGLGLGAVFGAASVAGLFYLILGGKL